MIQAFESRTPGDAERFFRGRADPLRRLHSPPFYCLPVRLEDQVANNLTGRDRRQSIFLDDVSAPQPSQHLRSLFTETERDEVSAFRRDLMGRPPFGALRRCCRSLISHAKDSGLPEGMPR